MSIIVRTLHCVLWLSPFIGDSPPYNLGGSASIPFRKHAQIQRKLYGERTEGVYIRKRVSG